MRTLLISFLIAFLPIQASWALVATYDNHAQTSTKINQEHISSHMAHHEHEQVNTTLDTQVNELSFNLDNDCGVCHIACCKLMSTAQTPLPTIDLKITHTSQLALLAPIDLISDIERPIWQPTL